MNNLKTCFGNNYERFWAGPNWQMPRLLGAYYSGRRTRNLAPGTLRYIQAARRPVIRLKKLANLHPHNNLHCNLNRNNFVLMDNQLVSPVIQDKSRFSGLKDDKTQIA